MEYKIKDKNDILKLISLITSSKAVKINRKTAVKIVGSFRWQESDPDLEKVIDLFNELGMQVLIRENTTNQEYVVTNNQEVSKAISAIISYKGIKKTEVEIQAKLSKGIISRWKKKSPRISNVLDIIAVIDTSSFIIRDDEGES